MRTRHIRPAVRESNRCHCGDRITTAECGQGWCRDCDGSEGLGSYGYLSDARRPLFCKTHRRRVRADGHCVKWMCDK